MRDKEYALYKDDEFITIGTLKQIAEYLGVTIESVRTYKAKQKFHRYPYIFIELEVEDNESNN